MSVGPATVSGMATRKPAAKDRPSYRCTECGWTAIKWLGRCGECQAWGTVVEFGGAPRSVPPRPAGSPPRPVRSRRSTGGRPPPGPPGCPSWTGCSAAAWCRAPWCCSRASPASASPRCCWTWPRRRPARAPTLYVTGEESACQVRLRADRIERARRPPVPGGRDRPRPPCSATSTTSSPSLLVLDSVQTVASPEIDGAPGGMAQVREVAGALIRASKERGMSTLLVGHVTKDGAIAGPRLLEHLVDVVLQLRGRPARAPAPGPRRQEPVRRRRTRSAASSCTTRASPASPTRPGSSSPGATSRCPAPA